MLCILVAALLSQEAGPAFRPMRQDEDWSKTSGVPLKNLPLGRWRLTMGGDVRSRFEWIRNDAAQDIAGDGFFLQRFMLHADLSYGRRIRFFTQLKSGLERGRLLGPRPIDKDKLDVHLGFVDLGLRDQLTLRAGRQELNFGSGRLISIREGPNVRLSFDGARLTWIHRDWQADVLAVRPSQTNPGFFDNSPDSRQALWGVYSTWTPKRLDLYYIGQDNKRRRFDAGVGREQRHSFGARWWKPTGKGRDHDWEAVWQTGSFRNESLNAWTVASSNGYTWEALPGKPRFGWKANVASGDRDPRDRTLGTFNAIFPKGNYFSQADLLGPYNLMDVHPSLRLELGRGIGVTTDADVFWRHSTRDGLYDVPGFLIVSGANSRARFIGHAVKAGLDWKVNPHFALEAEYQHFWAGTFLKEIGRTRAIQFFALWATYRF